MGRRWTKEEEELLASLASDTKNETLMEKLGRSLNSIKSKKKLMGLSLESRKGMFSNNYRGITKAERMREYRILYPDRVHAQEAVRRAKENGTLVPEPCVICGHELVEAHHEDYSLKLDVVWLCHRHHRQRHLGKISDEQLHEAIIRRKEENAKNS